MQQLEISVRWPPHPVLKETWTVKFPWGIQDIKVYNYVPGNEYTWRQNPIYKRWREYMEEKNGNSGSTSVSSSWF